MILLDSQQNIVTEGLKFVEDDNEQVFQFSGGPGTGKSVVLYALAQALCSRYKCSMNNIAPMAYIGQAAINMRTKGFPNAKTIHSWLFNPVDVYLRDKNGNIIYDFYLDIPKITTGFEDKPLENIDFIFIDEGGSVPYKYRHDILKQGKKVFVAGDINQLPPVKDKPAFLTSGKIHYLTEILRQKKNSNILRLADMALKGQNIPYGFYGDCLVIDQDDITNEMLLRSDIILCGKNSTKDLYNQRIRHLLGFHSKIPNIGERLICRKNNWNKEIDGINLANGLLGTVTNQIGIEGFNGKSFKIDFLPLMFNTPFTDLVCDYNYFIADTEKKKIIKQGKYPAGEMFDYGYCITTHLAQGAQFNNGMYIEEYLDPSIQKNLNFTGITRFRNSIIYAKRKRKYY